MIDPIHSLAFSIQANRGVYAILLGSGVSRSAGIPTGWEITLDLVRKLAVLHGEECEPEPDRWYRDKFGKSADYSDLLDNLAKSPSERQQLLRSYWEPSEEEREQGAKQPTEAHHAIAAMAAKGFVRVIVTTNFDRLMESALIEAGVTPTVLSSPDQVHGALPLIHTQCCLFKVHGDYLDTRIRNTPTELDSYPSEFEQLLDRIFDEFGLVVCGWSAEWDEALRRALYRAPSRRFTTFWSLRGAPRDEARRLIEHRRAQIVSVQNADTFFQALWRNIESLEEFSKPHPLSVDVAVASLKRYLSESRYRIQLSDLIDEEVDQVVEQTAGAAFAFTGVLDKETLTARVRGYEAACSTLLSMAPVAGYWAEEEHFYIWQKALVRLSVVSGAGTYALWSELQRYPAMLLLYSLGLGAVEAGRLKLLSRLLWTTVLRENREERHAVEILPPFCMLSRSGSIALEGMDRHYAPLNDWLHEALRQVVKRLIPGDDRYTLIFDRLEILIGLAHMRHTIRRKESYWAPLGAFGYRWDNRERIIQEIEQSVSGEGDQSQFVASGIFGDSAEICTQTLTEFRQFLTIACRSWR